MKLFISLLLILFFTSTASAQAVVVPSPVPSCANGDVLSWNTATALFVCTSVGAASQPFNDSLGLLANNADPTKVLRFDVSAIASATTRTWTIPDANVTVPTTIASLAANTFTALQTLNGGFSGTTGVLSSTLSVAGATTLNTVAYTWPGSQGSADTFLKNDGAGVLSWGSQSAALPNPVTQDLLFTDATYDVGKSGATRPRDGFFSRNFVVGGTLGVTGASTITSLSATSGAFSTTLSVTGASTLAAISATSGSFSSIVTATGAITSSGGIAGTTGTFTGKLLSGASSALTSRQAEIVGATDGLIAVIANDSAGESGLVYYGYDSTAVIQKTGAAVVNWTDATHNTGYASWNEHASYMVAGVQTDEFGLVHWANNGAAFFPADITSASAPGDAVLKVNGTFLVTGVATLSSLADLTGLTITATTTARPVVNFNNATSGALGQLFFADDGGFEIRRKKTSNFTHLQFTAAGAAAMANYGAGTATFDASGNITSVSDERMKVIQGPFTSGLTAILGLRPILFRYNQASGLDRENTYAGFSAQNVLGYIPEAIGKNLEGLYSLNIVPILASAVTAIQELSREVDELRAAAKMSAKQRSVSKVSDEKRIVTSATPSRLAEIKKQKEQQ